jgi:hypothetical protein
MWRGHSCPRIPAAVSNERVGTLSRTGAISRNVVLGLLVAVLVFAATVKTQQYLLRSRAEQLLADIRSLDVRKSSFEEAQQVHNRWKRWAEDEGSCDLKRCQFRILLTESPRPVQMVAYHLRLGGRPAGVWASVQIQDGYVMGKSFSVGVLVPPYTDRSGNWGRYTLIGDAYSVRSREMLGPSSPRHPEYSVGKPSGCDGPCLEVHAKFTPYADPADVRHLMQFDFSCLTRWVHPCRKEADIMPVAWSER